MEKLKKTILQVVTTGTTITGGTVIIPDLTAIYHLKIGLKQSGHDIGFLDAYVEPDIPTDSRYLVDDDNAIFVDDDGNRFIY